MKTEDHCKLTKNKFGRKYLYIHKYLDKFYKVVGKEHRKALHHVEGILLCANEIKRMKVYEYDCKIQELIHVAAYHVACDYDISGKQYPIPRREDYYLEIDGEKYSNGNWPLKEPWSNLSDKPKEYIIYALEQKSLGGV